MVQSSVCLKSKGLDSTNKAGMTDLSWTMERAQDMADEFQLGKYLALGTQKRLY